MNAWICLLVLLVAVEALPSELEQNVAETKGRFLRKTRSIKQGEKRTAAQAMRAFNARRREFRQGSAEKEEETAELEKIAEEVTGGDKGLLQVLRGLNIFKRVDEDPVCSMSIDCTNETNRYFLDDVEYRTASGMCNNLDNFDYGMAEIQHRRLLSNAYRNGKWAARSRAVSRNELPSSRSISNIVHKTDTDKGDNELGLSLALFYFMQFVDHDIIRTPEGDVNDNIDCCGDSPGVFCLPIEIESSDNDEYFEEGYCMDARRSFTVFECDNPDDFQNQINEITAYIDASMVYGSSDEEVENLRTYVAGFLKTSTSDFMPEAEDASDLTCDTETPGFCFDAGDNRANVIPVLTSFHTIFVREHNRIATYLGTINSDWSDEKIFQETRKIVAAEIQHITFNEMLPLVLDSDEAAKYDLYGTYQYNESVDASIIQAFSLGYRYHNMMPATLHMTEASGSTYINSGAYDQEDTYEDPSYLFKHNYKGIDQIALGIAFNSCPYANGYMNDAARNKLFLDDNDDSYDLAALNIERGREWGTPAYYQYRTLCGVDASDISDFSDLSNTHDDDVIAKLESAYESVKDVDLWTGLITENKVGSSISGPTQSCLVAMQFSYLKYGDRFWYETSDSVGFTSDQLTEIKKVTLAKILCDNLDVDELPEEIFKTTSTWTDCDSIAGMDLSAWTDSKK